MAAVFILPPSSLPEFLAAGHGFQDEDVFGTSKPTVGHRRRARKWTAAPRTYTVAHYLDENQVRDLEAFYVGPLLNGSRHFIAHVRTEEGMRYWEAAWLTPPTYDPQPTPRGLLWRVVGSITTFGEPMLEQPSTGALTAAYGFALETSAVIYPPAALVAAYGFALEATISLTAAYGFALEKYVPQYLLREDGTPYEREDGSFILRED